MATALIVLLCLGGLLAAPLVFMATVEWWVDAVLAWWRRWDTRRQGED